MWYPLYNFNYIHHLLYIINCTWSIHKWSEASSIGLKTYQFLINFNMYFLIPLTSGISEITFSLHQKVNRWIFSVGGYRKCKFELIFFCVTLHETYARWNYICAFDSCGKSNPLNRSKLSERLPQQQLRERGLQFSLTFNLSRLKNYRINRRTSSDGEWSLGWGDCCRLGRTEFCLSNW